MNTNYLIFKPENVFLLDSFGAGASAFGLIGMATFSDFFGMPADVLYGLLPIPLVYAVYSLSCWLFRPRSSKPGLLALIALANTAYCAWTCWLVWLHAATLTLPAFLHFGGEVIIVALVVRWEYKVLRQWQKLG